MLRFTFWPCLHMSKCKRKTVMSMIILNSTNRFRKTSVTLKNRCVCERETEISWQNIYSVISTFYVDAFKKSTIFIMPSVPIDVKSFFFLPFSFRNMTALLLESLEIVMNLFLLLCLLQAIFQVKKKKSLYCTVKILIKIFWKISKPFQNHSNVVL